MSAITQQLVEKGKNILISVGKNNKPTYTMMAIATANGIFKPISSLTDKKEKPEARKYAALREFLTECVAVPTYWACGTGAAALGAKLFSNPKKQAIAKTNMNFLGVCVAALFVIPALCSVVMKPLDNILKKDKKAKNPSQKLDVTSNAPEIKTPDTKNPMSDATKFGNLTPPDITVFANRGGLKI